jgi:hypothetical protein
MPKITLTGRVLPDAVMVNMILPSTNWNADEAGLKLEFQIRIVESVVTIDCESNRFNAPQDVAPIWQRAFDLVRSAVDLLAFADARGYTVILDRVIDPAGAVSAILPEDPRLRSLITAIHPDKNFGEIWRIIVAEPAIFQAMNDLVTGIALPHQSAVNCARVVEALSHLIGGVGAEAAARWKALRGALNLDRSYVQAITDISTNPRHGNRTYIPPATLWSATHRAWVIMDRFLEYKRRGGTPLTDPEFPILKG